MNCPKCQVKMESGHFDKIPINQCPNCTGKLINQRLLLSFLKKLSFSITSPIENIDLEPKTIEDSIYSCPKCNLPMEKFGYMGTNKVYIDNCNTCRLIWIDNYELTEMCALFIQTNAHLTERTNLTNELISSMNTIISVHSHSLAMQQAFLLGYVLG